MELQVYVLTISLDYFNVTWEIRQNLKLFDWMFVSEMHPGSRSWLLSFSFYAQQASCSFWLFIEEPDIFLTAVQQESFMIIQERTE